MITNFSNDISFTAVKKPVNSIRRARLELVQMMKSCSYRPTVSVDVADIKGNITMSIQNLGANSKGVLAKIERNDGYASRYLTKGSQGKINSFLSQTPDSDIQNQFQSLDRILQRTEREEAKSLTDF